MAVLGIAQKGRAPFAEALLLFDAPLFDVALASGPLSRLDALVAATASDVASQPRLSPKRCPWISCTRMKFCWY